MGPSLSWLLAACCAALLLAHGAARAEPVVTLRSDDGSTQVTGELLDYDGTTYTVRTGVGTMTVAADQVSCEGQGCPVDLPYGERFAVVGSNVIGEGLMPALVEGYADTLDARLVREVGAAPNEQVLRIVDEDGNELAAIDLRAHGTAAAFPALAEGAAVIGLASLRAANPEDALAETTDEHILALDGLIVITHPENPVGALTLDEVAALFAGRITNWSQLGGPDQPVNLYVPAAGSGTLAVFEAEVMRPRGLAVADSAERLDDNADLSDLVSIDPGGLGVTAFAFARAAKMLAIRKQCGLLSRPTPFAMKTEEYPLSRRLYAYSYPEGMPAHAEGLLRFALSDAAQPIIADAGFVDRGIESQGIEVQGGRLVHSLTSPEEFSLPLFREMLEELKQAQRLSVTFRFTRGSTELETRSRNEAERFAARLAEGAYAGHDVLLVGFADSVGEFEVNRDLAERRATAVLEALRAAVPEGALADVPIRVQSYGELTPVGCNETSEGRQLNRRVEVWVREQG